MRKNYVSPNPVNNLYRDALHGRLSRREIMKRGTALGLSSALMGTILRAEATGAQGTPAADRVLGWSLPDAETLQNELQLSTDFAGVAFNYMGPADSPTVPFVQRVFALFNEITGAQATLVQGAESTTDRLQFMLQTFAAQAGDIDAGDIDVIWPGILASHAVDLAGALPEGDFFQPIIENNTANDKLVGIPMYTDAGLLYSRTDLLEKYGFDGPPVTWDDLEEMAQTIMEGETAETPQFTGFVWQGNAYEGLTCDALEWQYSNGGGKIINPDTLEVTLYNEQAIEAFEMAKGWVGTISPQAVTGYMEEDARAVWQGGNAAFMRNWPYAYSLSQAEDSVIRDKFTVGQLPTGDGETHAATLGGWQAFVSQYSQNQEVAKEFVRFYGSAPIQRARAIELALLPTIASLYEDPDVLAAQPYYEQLFDVFAGGAVPRPSTPAQDLYNEVSITYFTGVNQILTGAEAEPTVAAMAAEIEDIMEDL